MKRYELHYYKEAPRGNENFSLAANFPPNIPDDGWEKWSLPLGNGYMGANVFGRVKEDRIQITENSLSNPYAKGSGGLNNFCELYIDTDHEAFEDYRRGLIINDALCYTGYTYNGIRYKREYFTSYPDRVLVIRLSADRAGAVSFAARPVIPFIKPYLFEEGDGMGKSGSVEVSGDTITLSGKMDYYNIFFEGGIKVINKGGQLVAQDKTITVKDADEAMIIMAVGTNYRMSEKVFTEDDPKKKLSGCPLPHEYVEKTLKRASMYTYYELFYRHKADFSSLFDRTYIDLGGENRDIAANELLDNYKNGQRDKYMEEMYFQYGRYLLISSSRPGTYPANLQGTWNKYDSAPWSSGYWHNINVQMNYWPAFNTDLFELFLPYADYFKAYLPLAKEIASEYIAEYFPENHEEGNGADGWIIGTGAWLYTIFGPDKPFSGHSGPGTGGFTAKLFMDYYEFTQDTGFLREVAYPALLGMSRFLSKVVIEKDGKFLAKYSASPEQEHNGKHYYTTGCAFDQQMIYETYSDTLKAAEILKDEDPLLDVIRKEIDRLDPVLIGKSGQIKEFREEEYYGDIGEKHHRHISMLIGLTPGTIINGNTPEWLKAAEVSLDMRGDESTGWSTAHKLNAWARIKNGKRAYDLLNMLLTRCTLPNFWDMHPPFQIDGNFGATAGIAEMLIQSHEGYIRPIPALPDEWADGSFSGLTARGGFKVGAKWKNKRLYEMSVFSVNGGKCRIYVGDGYKCGNYPVTDGFIEFDTEKGKEYIIPLS